MQANSQTLVRLIIGVTAVAAILFLVWYFSSVVTYILISAVLAIMCRPLVDFLSKLHVRRVRVPRWTAALLTLIVIWIVFIALSSLFVPLISHKAHQLAELDFNTVISSVADPIRQIQNYLSSLFALPKSNFSLSDALVSSLKSLVDYQTLNTAFTSVLNVVLSSIVAFFSISFITFFFLKDNGLFYEMVTSVFPQHYQENVTRALDSVSRLLSRYFTGILTESLLLLTASSLVMMAFGMKTQDAFFIGLIMGVMNVIPYAGPLMGGLIAVFVGMVTPIAGMTVGHTMLVISGSLLILKGMDDFILQPLLYSERVKAHPLEIFLVILIAGSLAGILGMLLAIPSYTVIRVFAKEFFSQFSLVQKLTQKI
ncbi:MAG: AI-2E family transporter [Alistipes sp.]